MKHLTFLLAALMILSFSCENAKKTESQDQIAEKVDSVMAKMNLEEKIGQLNQLPGRGVVTGPLESEQDYITEIKKGHVGSMLNVNSASYTRKVQKVAVEESRLGIPLLFGYDVIHGYKTIFPVPLGESASWDMDAIKKSARVAAQEATAAGQHWTFAPMVDISRDPRWGRIMEGAGEDPYLGTKVAKARVNGFQGENLNKHNTLMACAKHFAAYGAPIAGKDYNTVNMSERKFREIHIPPLKAAKEAGVSTFMSSFNELNGIPMTGNKEKLKGIIKDEWEHTGFILSDWSSVHEMVVHGYAKDNSEAAKLAMDAGVDMDMVDQVYIDELQSLVESGEIKKQQINESVRRILRKKFELGLFEDPYKYCDTTRENEILLSKENREAARDVARESMVLLKNADNTLPLDTDISSMALIGPLAKSKKDLIGTWSARGNEKHTVSFFEGLENTFTNTTINYVKGCEIEGSDKAGFDNAIRAAQKSDVIVAAVGEKAMMSGEALCRAHLDLPGVQKQLITKLAQLNKPLIVVLFNGRPLAIPEVDKAADAVLEAWLPGTEGGNAVADILSGDYNPSGKLPVTFPRTVGQVPIYYSHKNTGRPKQGDSRYTSRYINTPNTPLYPFGYGLSFTNFKYSDIQLNKDSINFNETLKITTDIKNTGDYEGEEIIQLYIRDMVGSVTRPVKEMKGFKKVSLENGEEKSVTFELTADDLAYYTKGMEYKAEPGNFKVFVGKSSQNVQEADFKLVKTK